MMNSSFIQYLPEPLESRALLISGDCSGAQESFWQASIAALTEIAFISIDCALSAGFYLALDKKEFRIPVSFVVGSGAATLTSAAIKTTLESEAITVGNFLENAKLSTPGTLVGSALTSGYLLLNSF